MVRRTILFAIIALFLVTGAVSSQAQEDPWVKVAMEAGKVFVGPLPHWIHSATSEHPHFYPIDDRTFIIPMCDCGKSRISYNFDHQSWVPRGSRPVRVRLTIHGVDDTIRRLVWVRMKCDKGVRADRFRSGWLCDGSEFYLEYGTDRDRAYYFVERGQIRGQDLPRGAYFRIDRIDQGLS